MTRIEIGDLLEGRYRVEARIAQGGMSTVYRCTDIRLGRQVAAKVMHEKYINDPIFSQRFVREARSMARLSDPCLVGVYDFNSDGDSIFLIMELITGGTIRELLAERGPMPVHAAVSIMRSVLTGLSTAHRSGLIHRDIKPENVLISEDHQVKLADFGLVRSADARGATHNKIVGTVSYLSPEQVTGESITAASDVYSAGILFFELLTGQTPFHGETQLAHALARVENTLPAPSSIVGGIPKLVDELVATATAQNPAERFLDADEFLTALNDVARALNLPDYTVPLPVYSATRQAAVSDNAELNPSDFMTTTLTGPDETAVIEEVPPVPPVPRSETQILPAVPEGQLPPNSTLSENRAPSQPPAPQSPAPTKKPALVSNRSTFSLTLWLIIVGIITIVVAIGAWWFGSGRYGEIPQVVGMDQEQAATAIENAGFITELGEIYDDTVEENLVAGTDPASGNKAVKGKPVTILLSLGAPSVPDFDSYPTVAAYKEQVEKRRLVFVQSKESYSDSVPKGDVITVTPAPGTTMRVGEQVKVEVSKGRAPVNIPSVEDQSVEKARRALEKLGLTVVETSEFSNTTEGGHVIKTTPAAGTKVAADSTVTLVVSTAIKVPNVAGMTELEAKEELAAAGLSVGQVVQSESDTGVSADEVVTTNPSPGTLLSPENSTVDLVLVGKVEVPNVIGKTVRKATEILEDAGFTVEVSGSHDKNALVYWQSPISVVLSSAATKGTQVNIHAAG